jgi:hypothetical protein
VRLPNGLYCKVMVRLWIDRGYVIANADPCGRLPGEDPESSAAFPPSAELEAERIGLESL